MHSFSEPNVLLEKELMEENLSFGTVEKILARDRYEKMKGSGLHL